MKIVQEKLFNFESIQEDNTVYATIGCCMRYDPDKLTGITAIYFECTIDNHGGNSTTDIQLYDLDTAAVIATLTYTGTGISRQISSDIFATLGASARNLAVKARANPVPGYGYADLLGIKLIILQDTSILGRLSETDFSLVGTQTNSSNTFNTVTTKWAVPKWTYGDGAIVKKLIAFVFSQSGGTAEVDLYDVTATASVSGSLMSTNSTTPVKLESSDLTLTEGHIYAIRVRNQTNGKNAIVYGAHIVLQQSGFSKIVAVVAVGTSFWGEELSGAYNLEDIVKFRLADLEAVNNLTFAVINKMFATADDGPNVGLWIYNVTQAGTVTGTQHLETPAVTTKYKYDDNITAPANNDTLQLRGQTNYALYIGAFFVIAYMQEDFPVPFGFYPDVTQPSGYHCFMKQFIRNRIAAYVPMKTPDGINKCW